MNEELFDLLWRDFAEKERHAFNKSKRKYLHFDRRINFSLDVLKDSQKFLDAFSLRFKEDFKKDECFGGSYYPFIRITLSSPRYKWNELESRRILQTKQREICYASHFDALRYSWYSTILSYGYEKILERSNFNKSVLAYRKLPGKPSNIDFAFKAFQDIKDFGTCVALAFDISKFFPTINHQILYNSWITVLKEIYPTLDRLPRNHYKLFESITCFQFIDKELLDDLFAHELSSGKVNRLCSPMDFRNIVRSTKAITSNPNYIKDRLGGGIPQGSPVSAVLANISLIDFDQKLYNSVENVGGSYYRYSDDLLVICPDGEESNLISLVENLVKENGLSLNDKTDKIWFKEIDGNIISTNAEGKRKTLQYLGFETNGKSVYIRSSSFSRYHSKVRKIVNRTINMAFGKHSSSNIIFKSKLLNRFTQKGNSNFIKYASRASENGEFIKKQYKNQYKNLSRIIKRKSESAKRKRA